jgi:ankyrin repeat/SOCS box protein 17
VHTLLAKTFTRVIVTLLKFLRRRFIDVPMESYGQVVPLHVAVQNASPDILQIMLRYGASVGDDQFLPAPIEILLARMNEYNSEDQYPQQLLMCLKLLLRSIPTITKKIPSHERETFGLENISIYDQYPNLAIKNLLPAERSGNVPPELKHLCRCRIRQCLSDNWALPHGIKLLQIPTILQDYLDLQTD